VGFLFAYPDRFRAVAAMRGERGPLALLRYLRHRHTDAVDFKTLGVLPEHRRAGVAAALMCQGHLDALRKGYRLANHCLFREGNPSGEMDGGAGRVLRRYNLYRWPA
jgi:GNAT superfamily N-acetyltransferase